MKSQSLFSAALFLTLLAQGFVTARDSVASSRWHFDFGGAAGTRVKATSANRFSMETGYGFDLETVGQVTTTTRADSDASHDGFCTSGQPWFFSVAVPEGNYRVTVVLGDPEGETDTTIKAESRRLMVESAKTKRGEFVTRTFVVNVRNASLTPPPVNAPGGTHVDLNDREQGVLHWDDKLTLEFNGPRPAVCTLDIEPVADAITVFLAGDSTVTDQPREPGASWGQMLPRFFKDNVAVANHAESGETMKSFLTAHRFDKLLSAMKPGDYLFIQFGHNDSKIQWPQTYVEAFTTYKAYLKVFVAEARRRGATPVLVTSMHRRVFDDHGKIKNTHGDYPEAVRQVAREENVALVDLHAMSAQLYETLGPEKSPLAFSNNGKDATHHNNYGAYELAKCVVTGIRAAKLPLAGSLADDVPLFDPAKPDPVESFTLSPSPGRSALKPRGD
ncbi:MAG: rhamnogalacturonan acetylesterase [Nibricoccus sp.]